VSIPEPVFRTLRDAGNLEEVGGLWVQAADDLYDDQLGLCADGTRYDPGLFIQ
jgi:hypothetical protein